MVEPIASAYIVVALIDTQPVLGALRTATELTLRDYFLTFFRMSVVEASLNRSTRVHVCVYSDGAAQSAPPKKTRSDTGYRVQRSFFPLEVSRVRVCGTYNNVCGTTAHGTSMVSLDAPHQQQQRKHHTERRRQHIILNTWGFLSSGLRDIQNLPAGRKPRKTRAGVTFSQM